MSRRAWLGAGLAALLLAVSVDRVAAQVPDWPSERPPRPLAARDVKFPPYALKTLANGLQVIAVSHHEQPAVSLRLMVRAGPVTKVQAGGYVSRAAADAACRSLKQAGHDCLVTDG